MKDLHDLQVLIESAVPIVVVETHEERRVQDLVERLSRLTARPLYRWTATEGLQRVGHLHNPDESTRAAGDTLARIKTTHTPGIYLLCDMHPFLDEALHVRLLKDIALGHPGVPHTLVLVSHRFDTPPEIQRFCAKLELSVPDRDQVRATVLEQAKLWSQRHQGRNVRTSRKMLDRLVENLLGLPGRDVVRLARGAIEDDGALSEDDLPGIMRAKFDLLGQDGVLGFECDTAHLADVGGLDGLKRWLELREPVFTGRVQRPGLDRPRGVLLLGVQGCGKSLAAKAVAGAWGVPLLRLDFGTLYNKFHGETERNLRESLRQAELMSPCVLWIDEIEKGVSSESGDAGVSRRVLGTLLTWMAENRKRVFMVATANDIDTLPPELLRKGRMDEIFFVDLPDAPTRRVILDIHLRRREIDPRQFDLEAAVAACDGFSGAEIEQAVVAALYSAYARGTQVDGALLMEEIASTRPLSVVMAERVQALRAWAAGRTVPAA